MRISVKPLCVAALLFAAACDETAPGTTLPASLDAELRRAISPWSVVPILAPDPQDPAQVALGRALMFDKILSGNRDISCATCHEPALHMGDGLPLAIGTGGIGAGPTRTLGPGRSFVPRNAPSLLNAGVGLSYMFWDGRLARFGPPVPDVPVSPDPSILAAQAMLPVLNRREMRGDAGDTDVSGNPNELAQIPDDQPAVIWRAVMQRLLAVPEYANLFAAAYPGVPQSSLTFNHAAQAIAAFQMATLMKTDSPFDRYLKRDDAALGIEEKRGALLFFTKARCVSCHNGPFLGGQSFSNSGVPQVGPGVGTHAPLDVGRGELPNMDFYQFAFRVPPLRNVELSAPYFHDGSFLTLEAVVAHYNDVAKSLRAFDPATLPGAVQGSYHGDQTTVEAILANLDFQLRTPLNLTRDEQHQLVAFLKSLTDPSARDLSGIAPASVPSGLPVH